MIRRIFVAALALTLCAGMAFAAPAKKKSSVNTPASDAVLRLTTMGVVTRIDPVQKTFEFKTDNGQALHVSLAPNVRFEQQYAHNVKSYVGYATFDDLRVGDRARLEHHSNRNSDGIVVDRVDIYRD